jgi:hypothetical protein
MMTVVQRVLIFDSHITGRRELHLVVKPHRYDNSLTLYLIPPVCVISAAAHKKVMGAQAFEHNL